MPNTNLFLSITIKLIVTAIFPFILYPFNFYEKAELEILRSPKKILEFAKGIFNQSSKGKTTIESDIDL
jgi:hypothetical protein